MLVATALLLSGCATLLGGQDEVDRLLAEAGTVFAESIELVDAVPDEYRLRVVGEGGCLREQAVVVEGVALFRDLTGDELADAVDRVSAVWDSLSDSKRLTLPESSVPEWETRTWSVAGGLGRAGGYHLGMFAQQDIGQLSLSVRSGCYRGEG